MLQPSTELQLPALRAFSSASNNAIGNAIAALSVTPTQLGGFYAQPFRVPVDFDRSREARLFASIACNTAQPQAAGNVQLDALRGIAAAGLAPVEATITVVQAIPAAWPFANWLQVELGTPAAPFIPPSTIAPNAILGFRLARNGPATADTWTGALNLMINLILRYHRLCQFCDTCL